MPWLPWLLVAIAVAVGWFFRRRAPAVALGMVGLIIGGFLGHTYAHGTEVPSNVGQGALLGLLLLGGFGSVLTTPRADETLLYRLSAWAVPCGVLAVALAWNVMHTWTCRAYDPPTTRWCGGVDIMEGTSGTVTIEVAMGAIMLTFLLWFSARRARQAYLARAGAEFLARYPADDPRNL